MRVTSASRHYVRNLVVDAESAAALDRQSCTALTSGRSVLLASLDTLGTALTGSRDATYQRSASLFDRAERELEASSGSIGSAQLALRDLALLDGSLATLAATHAPAADRPGHDGTNLTG